ncbi:hypothetical protein ACS0TY_005368 [Phlomoides rotata]
MKFSTLMISLLTLYFFLISYTNKNLIFFPASDFFYPLLKTSNSDSTPTELSHIVFGLIGSEQAWHQRKSYIESWWRANVTRGLLFLDKPPSDTLLPWPHTSPPYRVSDDLTLFLNKSDIRAQRMVHGIMEVIRETTTMKNEFRWLVMGDDDSIFFVDNMVDVLRRYDYRKYYYIGGHSEFLLSDYLFSFNQAFGGGGIMLSYPLATALAADMENCLNRYLMLNSADNTTRACIADIGLDFRGDISGLLSAHPLTPLLSLHHFDMVDPIFPSKDRFESTRHLMAAAAADQSRLLQQTICYDRHKNWTFSISWGYSAHIYERIMPRSYLQKPIETFNPWLHTPRPPTYMMNTRPLSSHPCEAPHVFFMESVHQDGQDEILTTYSRAWPRALPPCSLTADHSPDYISTIRVFSPPIKRTQIDRCECCDIVRMDNAEAEIKFRECRINEIIA